ncbi:MAG: DUF1775 domain-containing protein [Gemmatimonadota bacterium]
MKRSPPVLRPRLIGGLLSWLLVPAVALGHAVVYPDAAGPGAWQKYVLRVPNERDVPTTRVEIDFPEAVRVVSFAEVEGWTLEVVTDAAGRVERAVWTGELPAMRFVEFPFVAVNPREDTRLVWPVVQVYAGGERVAWSGPEDSETPASVTVIGEEGVHLSIWTAVAALLVALASLGLALRPAKGAPAA